MLNCGKNDRDNQYHGDKGFEQADCGGIREIALADELLQ